MRGSTTKVGWQDRRPADTDAAHCSMARRLRMLFLLPVGMRITRDGIIDLQFSSVAKSFQFRKCSRRVARRGWKS